MSKKHKRGLLAEERGGFLGRIARVFSPAPKKVKEPEPPPPIPDPWAEMGDFDTEEKTIVTFNDYDE